MRSSDQPRYVFPTFKTMDLMNNIKPEFNVRNHIRSIVFALLYVEMFLIAIWLLPFHWSLVAISLLISTLMIIGCVPSLRKEVDRQLFDRIQLAQYGVQYLSGVFGESWMRPYNEFRVDCQKKFLSRKCFVKLKHRVLANLVIGKSMSVASASELVAELTQRKGLRKLRRD